MKDSKIISKGFLATKKDHKIEIKVDVAPLCFYIFIYENGLTKDQIHRSKLKKAAQFVEEQKKKYISKGYSIKDYGIHHVQIEKNTLLYKTKIC